MQPGVTVLFAAVCLALSGCPDWSRPDPALSSRAQGAPAPVEPQARSTRDGGGDGGGRDGAQVRPGGVAAGPTDAGPLTLDGLREGVRHLRATTGAADALARLELLESAGFDLLERGTADEQAAAEALLLELSDLRVEVVDLHASGE